MNLPAQTNNKALNMACATMWKYARFIRPRPRLVIIIPNCLRVDSAMIFFMSHSVVALRPAITIVDTATNSRILLNSGNVLKNG